MYPLAMAMALACVCVCELYGPKAGLNPKITHAPILDLHGTKIKHPDMAD